MTEKQLCDLPIPKWLGRPLYPGGFPLQKDNITYSDYSVEEIWRRYLQDRVENQRDPLSDDVKHLKLFIIYYVHAPVFTSEFTQELRDKINEDMSLDEMISLCLEYGLDPL
jgi:hypothetical protein